MFDTTITQLKTDYNLTTLPPTTKQWSERLTTPTLGNTITDRVYCPYCDTTNAKHSTETDDTDASVICPNCTNTIQTKLWSAHTPEPLDTLVFHCPNNCHDTSTARTVEIHKHDGYYTAVCTNCSDVCRNGVTKDKHQYEQLKHVLEAEQNGEYRDAANVSMHINVEVSVE